MPVEGERLQKVMARAGLGSRRACETMILEGRVMVNGHVVTALGTRVDPQADAIVVDGRRLPVCQAAEYLALYKPAGYLSTLSDPHGGPLVADLLPPTPRVYPVGRLDRASEGLMLVTNDGELALRLMHPRYQQEKEYRVLIRGALTAEQRARLEEGVRLPGKVRPAKVSFVDLPPGWKWRGESVPEGHSWEGLILREGHKREIREMLAGFGLAVVRLIRVRVANVQLDDLAPGHYRHLTSDEVAGLKQLSGLLSARKEGIAP